MNFAFETIRSVGSIFLLLLLVSYPSSSQTYIPKYSNDFLNIGCGARALATGGVQVATAQGAEAGYWNPALLANRSSAWQASLMHAEYFGGLASYDYAALAMPLDSVSSLGISLIRLSIDNIADTRFLFQNNTLDYSRIRSFSASDNALLISYGRRKLFGITNLSAGTNFKIIYRNAGIFANAWGFGLDAGLAYSYKKWNFGLMARDVLGTFNAWSYNASQLAPVFGQTDNAVPVSSIEITLPRLILGTSYKINVIKNLQIIPMSDLEITFDGKRNTLISSNIASIDPRMGLETGWNNMVFLRAGVQNFQYIKNYSNQNYLDRKLIFQPNFGIGLKFKKFGIDYAMTDVGNQSEALYSHIFSLFVNIK